jgi:endonuclease III
MRTSRIARDTQRVVDALSPHRRAATRRSLRTLGEAYAHGQVDATSDESRVDSGVGDAIDDFQESSTKASSSGLRKRKHDTLTSAATSTNETKTRQSPRKAPKLDPESAAETKRKARKQPDKRIKGPNGAVAIEPPANWEQMYNMTAEMRKRVLAPVDTMGCETLADRNRSPKDQRLQTLISLMLSSQTKDTVTAVAMRNLQEKLPGGFCLQSLLDVEPDKLNKLIEKVGFHNNKTKYIKATANILRDQFNGDIPDTIEGLTSLPGVGPKMAYLCMSAAWGRDEGIGVDVHVHRITNLWAWHKTSTPEQTRAELEAWLPKEKWHDINQLLVGFGQTVCLPVGRKCGECDLAREKLCPSAVAQSPVKKRVKREVEIKVEDGEVVKKEEVVVEKDDVGVKVEADTAEDGVIEASAVFAADDAAELATETSLGNA